MNRAALVEGPASLRRMAVHGSQTSENQTALAKNDLMV